jgi:predicted amidohydrolase
LRAGFIQFAPVLGDLKTTIEKVDRLVSTVDHADVLVLPELCNSGYNFESAQQAWETSEEVGDSVFLRYLQALCQRRGFTIVSGFNERDGDQLFNSSILVGPQGLLGVYRKLHLFLNEKEFFQPGNLGLPVFDIGSCKVGMLVCFDWSFPEVWRILALKGADVICHPSSLVLPGLAQRAVPIHALINRVYTVTANRIGVEGALTFTGLSTIAGPTGEVLMQASETSEQVGIVDLDLGLARDKQITARNHVFGDRRVEEYRYLLTETDPRH